jgi:hypothetical protein
MPHVRLVVALDSRFADYRFTITDVIADNTSAGRYVVGAPVPPDGIDLRLAGVVLKHNGEVAWLVRALAAAGGGLRAATWSPNGPSARVELACADYRGIEQVASDATNGNQMAPRRAARIKPNPADLGFFPHEMVS